MLIMNPEVVPRMNKLVKLRSTRDRHSILPLYLISSHSEHRTEYVAAAFPLRRPPALNLFHAVMLDLLTVT